MFKLNKLKEITLILICIILSIAIIKYLNIIKYTITFIKLLIPLLIGFIYAWLLNPLINKLSIKHNRNFICISIFLIIIILIIIFISLLIPTIYKEINELLTILPSIIDNINNKIQILNINIKQIPEILVDNLPLYIVNTIKKLIKYLGTIAIGLILGLYITFDYESFIKFIKKIIPKKYKCITITLLTKISDNVRKCINGTLLVAFLVFLLSTISFIIIKLPSPLLIGMFCGITDLIPYVGPYIGGIIAVMIGLTESKKIGIITLIICISVQSIENYILQPIIMSKTTKINPIFIIIGLLIFGELFGIIGMIISTPIISIIKAILDHIEESKEICSKKNSNTLQLIKKRL